MNGAVSVGGLRAGRALPAVRMQTPPPRRVRSHSKLSDNEGVYSDVPRRSSSHRERLHDHDSDPGGAYSDGARRHSRADHSSSRHGGPSGARSASKRNRPAVLPPAQAAHVNGHFDLEGGDGYEDIELKSPERKGRGAASRSGQQCLPPRPLTLLAICTVLFGPLGTLLTFLLLPEDVRGSRRPQQQPQPTQQASLQHLPSQQQPLGGGPGASHMRVLHLSLAHSEVKARFVIDERSDWEGFLSGCAERLKVGAVAMVTDATGEGIHSIADLVHEDNIIVHAAEDAAGNHTAGTAYDAAAAAAAVAAANPAAAAARAGSPAAGAGAGGVASATNANANAATNANAAANADADANANANAAAAAAMPKPIASTSALLHASAPVCGSRHPDFRVAMLIPMLGAPPPYLPYFVASAARSGALIDWLVFHEHQPLPWEPRQLPSNVKLVDLGGGGLAELVGLKLGERLGLPLRNATTLLRSLRLLFERWPRLIAEYKPTFGTVFEDFLGERGGCSMWSGPERYRAAPG